MAGWSEAQVLEWITLIDLPHGCCAEAVQRAVCDMDGEDMLSLRPKTLPKVLRAEGVDDSSAVALAILRQRDSANKQDSSAAAGAAAVRTAEVSECPLCMEPYADDDSESHVPRTLPCGHTACQQCFAKMLRPIAADGDYKKLECPSCRVVTAVLRGKASNLQKNFALLC